MLVCILVYRVDRFAEETGWSSASRTAFPVFLGAVSTRTRTDEREHVETATGTSERSMSGISILRGDCWTELMLTAFADGRDGSHLQEPYAGLSVKTANGAADLVFKTVEAGTVQQDKLVVQNSGSGTATLRGLRCVPERPDGAISIVCELPEGGALLPPGSSYQVEVHSTAPPVVGLHYTFVLALLEVEERTERALISHRVLVGARACLMVTDPEGMAALNPEASTARG